MECVNKSEKKNKKYTHGAVALEDVRAQIRLDKRSFAAVLCMPYRTYQDYAYGARSVPDHVLVAAKAALKRDRAIMKQIIVELNRDLDRRYPFGIQSEATIRMEVEEARQ
jgi:hypothetical protein